MKDGYRTKNDQTTKQETQLSSPLHDDAVALLLSTVAFSSLWSCIDRYSGCFCEDFGYTSVMLCRAFYARVSITDRLFKGGESLPRYRLALMRLATARPSSYRTVCFPRLASFSEVAGSSRRSHLQATRTSYRKVRHLI